MKHYIALIRPKHWVKNFFIFTPLFFSGKINDTYKLFSGGIAFFAFCIVASGIYILNDLKDIEKDKIHPEKKNRPLASDNVSKKNAIILMLLLFTIGFSTISLLKNNVSILILSVYVILNIIYSMGLKNVSIIDVSVVSFGFVLRVAIGGSSTSIDVSQWLFIMTFLLALFLAFAKRRDDIVINNIMNLNIRKASNHYNLEFINSTISILCSVMIVTYLLYITSNEVAVRFKDKPIYFSVIFVILGVLRYLQITLVEEKSGSPTKVVFKDVFIQITILCWVVSFLILIYL